MKVLERENFEGSLQLYSYQKLKWREKSKLRSKTVWERNDGQ